MKYLAVKFGKDKSGTASTPVEQKININTASAADIAAGLNLSNMASRPSCSTAPEKANSRNSPTCEEFRISM
jgi:hypothetical protein